MKNSGIGGQAVIEGIMMKNKDLYAIAIRKPDNEIEVTVKEKKDLTTKLKLTKVPIIRGIFRFIDSLTLGISTLTYSSSFYEEEQEKTKLDKLGEKVFKDKLESVIIGVTVLMSAVIAIGLFMIFPFFLSRLLSDYIEPKIVLNIIEGAIRLLLFILYVVLISQLEDIKRVFMYHGAEHKCINCIENGLKLEVDNVRKSSKLHKRCGTSFMLFVIVISIILFIFIKLDNPAMQLLIRVLLVPVIAGISYEILKLAGSKENALTNALSKPGMWLQGLTTKEPTDDMIEVAIAAVEAVFDWKAFQNEKDEETGEADELDGFEMIDVADTEIEEEQSEDLVFEETVEDSEDIVEDKPKRIEDIRTIDDIEEIFEDVAV
ncbi:MAG: DUF1385 domain-containing protein [Lachnospiraceae bacterium]|nr:DUF1385 domain-containing protein [Lachnospiraceae bacterium]